MGYRGVSQWSGLGPRGVEGGLGFLGRGLCLEVCRAHLWSLALEVELAQWQEAVVREGRSKLRRFYTSNLWVILRWTASDLRGGKALGAEAEEEVLNMEALGWARHWWGRGWAGGKLRSWELWEVGEQRLTKASWSIIHITVSVQHIQMSAQ